MKAAKRVRAIPKEYHTVTPALSVRGAAEAIEFYKKASGAQEVMRMPGPDGKSIMHAEIKIGDSIVFLGDEFPDMGGRSPQTLGGSTAALHICVPDADAAFTRAVEAGAQVRMPVMDMFWGDRYGRVADPFGHEWELATHKEDLTPKSLSQNLQRLRVRAGHHRLPSPTVARPSAAGRDGLRRPDILCERHPASGGPARRLDGPGARACGREPVVTRPAGHTAGFGIDSKEIAKRAAAFFAQMAKPQP